MYLEALDAVLQAAVDASEDHFGGCTYEEWKSDDRNEQWVQSYAAIYLNDLARKLAQDKQRIFVTVETKASWLNYYCGISSKTGPKDITRGQRFDLAMWSRADSIAGLVEIKNAPRAHDNSFGDDLKKLRRAIDRWGPTYGGTLAWGIYLFSAVARGRSRSNAAQRSMLEAQRRVELLPQYDGFTMKVRHRPASQSPDCVLTWTAVGIRSRGQYLS